MNLTHRALLPRLFLVLVAASVGCTDSTPPPPQPDSKPTSLAPAEGKVEQKAARPAGAPAEAAASSSCAVLLETIRRLESGVPVIFTDFKRPATEVLRDIVECVEACQKLLADCGGAAETCEARATLVRMELARLQRFQQDLPNTRPELSEEGREQAYKAHVEELIQLAKRAATECPEGSQSRATALRVLLDLHNRGFQFDKVPQVGEQLLKEYPTYPYRPSVHLAVADALIADRRYAEAVKYLQAVIKDHWEDLELVLYHGKLLDALLGVGDLEGVEDLVQLMRAEYPKRLPLIKESNYLRNQHEQWLCMSLFWVGFVKMAIGDNDGARKAFHEHVAEFDSRTRSMAESGKAPGKNDICTITLQYRTMDMLEVLDKFYGKVPTNCFKLDDFWVSDNRLDWKDCDGKIVVAVFRSPGDQRAASFLQEVNALVKEHEKEGLLGITLSHVAGRPDPAADAKVKQALRDDLKKLNVTLPAGLDPDREGQKLFREVHATVGTASVVVFDRRREIAWFLADPRDMDRGVLRRVVERMLAGKIEQTEKAEKTEKSKKSEASK